MNYSEMIIHSTHTIKFGYILKQMIRNKHDSIIIGTKSCGKTKLINDLLHKQLDEESHVYTSLSFSAYTSENSTQDQIDQKTEKRRKGIYGPEIGKKLIVHIDDFNIPLK